MSNSFVAPWTAGSSVHGIFWARWLEWVAVSSCRGSFRPRYQTHVSPFPAWQADSSPGKPLSFISFTKIFLSFTAVSHLNCRPCWSLKSRCAVRIWTSQFSQVMRNVELELNKYFYSYSELKRVKRAHPKLTARPTQSSSLGSNRGYWETYDIKRMLTGWILHAALLFI